jgi:hypothetical protein
MDDNQQQAIREALEALSRGQTDTAATILQSIQGVHETVSNVTDILDQHGDILTRIFAAVAKRGEKGGDQLVQLIAQLIGKLDNQMVRTTEMSNAVMRRIEQLPGEIAKEMHSAQTRTAAE